MQLSMKVFSSTPSITPERERKRMRETRVRERKKNDLVEYANNAVKQ